MVIIALDSVESPHRERTRPLWSDRPARRLWSGVSAKGVARLSGRLGNARLTVLPARAEEWEGEGSPPTHTLLLTQSDASAAPPQDYGPSVDLAFLEQRTSARGKDYLAGWLGGARVIVTQIADTRGRACPLRPAAYRQGTGSPQAGAATTARYRLSPGPGQRQQAGYRFPLRRAAMLQARGLRLVTPNVPGSSGCGCRRSTQIPF